MKKLRTVFIATLVFILSAGSVHAQVEWKFSAKKIADKTYEIHLTAEVQPSWHIYSQSTPKGGPLPTKISFSKNPIITLQGKPKEEGELEMIHSDVFDVDVLSFSEKVDFVQTIKLKTNVKTNVTGVIEYMSCTEGQCTPPLKEKFSIKLE